MWQVRVGAVSEDRITFKLGDREQCPEALDDDLQQIAQNAVRVVKFHSRQVGGVAGDVREDEVTVLGADFDERIISQSVSRRVLP